MIPICVLPLLADSLPDGANGFREVSTKLGELWRALGAEDRAPLEAQAAADKEEKAEALQQWKASHPKDKVVRTASAFNVNG